MVKNAVLVEEQFIVFIFRWKLTDIQGLAPYVELRTTNAVVLCEKCPRLITKTVETVCGYSLGK